MGARELLEDLRNSGTKLIVDDGYIGITGRLSDTQREAIRELKPDLLEILEREEWQRRHDLTPTWNECQDDAGDLWETFDREQREGYRRSLTTSNQVRAGIVPSSFQYVVDCRKCGPVYTDIPIDTGCPWCRRNVPTELVPKPPEDEK